jgi:hypothetical protein
VRLALVASLLLSALASAQTQQPQPKPQKIDFGDDLINGERETPLGEIYIEPVRPGGFKSLIKVRMNFNDKLRESVHEM